MELKSWILYDSGLSKCFITGTKPFELNLSEKCREDFDKYLVGKHSLKKERPYKLLDVISDINEFCEKTNYRIDISSESVDDKYGVEKILINEIRPMPIRHVDDIENIINPFF